MFLLGPKSSRTVSTQQNKYFIILSNFVTEIPFMSSNIVPTSELTVRLGFGPSKNIPHTVREVMNPAEKTLLGIQLLAIILQNFSAETILIIDYKSSINWRTNETGHTSKQSIALANDQWDKNIISSFIYFTQLDHILSSTQSVGVEYCSYTKNKNPFAFCTEQRI